MVGEPEALMRKVELTRPDVVVLDIRMPPTHTDEGLVAAEEMSRLHAPMSVSSSCPTTSNRATPCACGTAPGRAGYLLKERVSDVAVLTDALHRIAEGECVVDPTIVSRLVKRDETDAGRATDREAEVLKLMAEGHSNRGICAKLFLSPKTVEAHVRQIFRKLGLRESPDRTAACWPCSRSCAQSAELPTGTLTFLFTDVEGSTRLLSASW